MYTALLNNTVPMHDNISVIWFVFLSKVAYQFILFNILACIHKIRLIINVECCNTPFLCSLSGINVSSTDNIHASFVNVITTSCLTKTNECLSYS